MHRVGYGEFGTEPEGERGEVGALQSDFDTGSAALQTWAIPDDLFGADPPAKPSLLSRLDDKRVAGGGIGAVLGFLFGGPIGALVGAGAGIYAGTKLGTSTVGK
jgi:hypothetical protein